MAECVLHVYACVCFVLPLVEVWASEWASEWGSNPQCFCLCPCLFGCIVFVCCIHILCWGHVCAILPSVFCLQNRLRQAASITHSGENTSVGIFRIHPAQNHTTVMPAHTQCFLSSSWLWFHIAGICQASGLDKIYTTSFKEDRLPCVVGRGLRCRAGRADAPARHL